MAIYKDVEPLEVFSYNGGSEDFNDGVIFALEKLDALPTADVEEVKHGNWLDRSDKGIISMTHPYVCSRCGRVEAIKEPYCNCGAKMYGGDTE